MTFKHKALTAAAALAAALLATSAAHAATARATAPVNVRGGPGTDYQIVDTLRRGERVEIDYCRGSWCAVQRPGPDGWVSANYLERGGSFIDDRDRYERDIIIERPRVIRRYPRYLNRRYGPDFSACFGGANARFCIYD